MPTRSSCSPAVTARIQKTSTLTRSPNLTRDRYGTHPTKRRHHRQKFSNEKFRIPSSRERSAQKKDEAARRGCASLRPPTADRSGLTLGRYFGAQGEPACLRLSDGGG